MHPLWLFADQLGAHHHAGYRDREVVLVEWLRAEGLVAEILPTPSFALPRADFAAWAGGRTSFRMEEFYRAQRRPLRRPDGRRRARGRAVQPRRAGAGHRRPGRAAAVRRHRRRGAGGLAIAVLGVEGGAVVGLPLGGALVARAGSRVALRLGLAVYVPGLLTVALAPGLASLTLGLAGWAAANSVVDVALNAQGVELGRRYRRPVLSSLHAAQGVGLLVGALGATAAATLDVSLLAHVAVIVGVGLAVGLAATVPLAPESIDPGPLLVRPTRQLLLLGAVAFCAFLVDGAATSWVAVHLRADHGAGEGVAAAGFLVFAAALVVGRLGGDRLSARVSRVRAVQTCGVGVAVGAAVALLAPNAPAALAGWALVGLAVAPLAPIVLGAAPDAADVPPAVAISSVTTVGYLGSFSGPPAIGVVAEVTGLSAALAMVAVAGVAAACAAATLSSTPRLADAVRPGPLNRHGRRRPAGRRRP